MGTIVQFRDYEKVNLPTTPWCERAKSIGDLRDRPSARIYILPVAHESSRIYPSKKLLPPVFLIFEDSKN